MNHHLEILKKLLHDVSLQDDAKGLLVKALADAEKQWAITDFKLDRTEKVKRTTAILLEETIEELEQKRAAVEAQNRELEIESSLERVRTVAMSMKEPDDMLRVCSVITEQLQLLHVEAVRNVQTAIFYPAKGTYMNYEYYAKHDKTFRTETTYNNEKHAAFAENMQRGDGQFFELNINGDEVKDWMAYQKTTNVFIDDFLYGASSLHYYWCSLGPVALGMSTYQPLTENEKGLFKRFSKVFELAYRRYIDIEKAEAQAREAQIEVALERVRSRTLAMQKSDELTETAAVLFQQLILLGIAPIRLYIGIVKEPGGQTEFWITDEDGGGARSAFEVRLSENPSFNQMLGGWQEGKKSLVIDMKGDELQQYLNYLDSIHVPFNRGPAQKRRMQYVAYFSNGFIGMASPEEQPAETLQLLERFASVFNLTFTRFNDLKLAEAHAAQAEEDLMKLQAEKRRAEEALSELQLTQKQLIQSEKMASLGELTAGIAHEIQNPLNFVNNFSEVSNELLDEMMEEVSKGNYEEVKAIAGDVKQNLEKISHHGRRADGIVKGMLQHSRSSSATKEPTDINALADEYLRLAYHGLRAKDKSFNATLETDYDAAVGKINVISQDIGRVVLNLITNAFYAVGEKKKSLAEGYTPVVSVSTKKTDDWVELHVRDNGKGIPEHLLDKIFQPFFTTKPTGQGTGLGLSLSYDIIKAHGGKLAVETREGEWTVFFIILPIE